MYTSILAWNQNDLEFKKKILYNLDSKTSYLLIYMPAINLSDFAVKFIELVMYLMNENVQYNWFDPLHCCSR